MELSDFSSINTIILFQALDYLDSKGIHSFIHSFIVALIAKVRPYRVLDSPMTKQITLQRSNLIWRKYLQFKKQPWTEIFFVLYSIKCFDFRSLKIQLSWIRQTNFWEINQWPMGEIKEDENPKTKISEEKEEW